MNNVIETLNKRTSLRSYDSKKVSEDHLDAILEGAMRAPTAGNMMTYSIIVIEDQDKSAVLSKTCDNQPFIAKAPLTLIFIADYQKWFDYYEQNHVEDFCKRTGREFIKPTEASLFLAAQDAIIAAQNAVIAAESLGIGSCYIGDIMEHYEEHKELLNLPDYAFPVGMLCLGYYPTDYHAEPRRRFNKEYVVFKDQYKRLSKDEINEMYNHLDERFKPDSKVNEEIKADNFAQLHYVFKTGSDFSKEMQRSIKQALDTWSGKKE